MKQISAAALALFFGHFFNFILAQTPSPQLFWAPNQICFNETFHPDEIAFDPKTYHWDFGDGQTSTAIAPYHKYSAAGDYKVKLCIEPKPNQVFVSSIKVLSHEPNNWSITDQKPDVYFELQNTAGAVMYSSETLWDVEDDAVLDIPCALLFKDPVYILHFWDYDSLDPDDDLGFVILSNPSTGGVFTFGKVSVFFTAVPAAPQYCYEQSLTVHQELPKPTVAYNAATNQLSVTPVLQNVIYRWYKNGSLLPDSIGQGPTITATGPGKYNMYINEGTCNSPTSNSIQVTATTATDEADATVELKAFPNPVDDLLSVILPEKLGENPRLTVSDLTGRALKTVDLKTGNSNGLELDFSKEATGVYWLTLESKESRTVQKIIVQH